MTLHLPTLLVMAVFVTAVASLLLLISWLQNRSVRALALWAGAFLMSAVGGALIAARGDIPNFWSITIANTCVAAGYGLMWGGARDFGHRAKSLSAMFAGAVAWIIACQNEWFFETPQARVALMSTIIVTYSLSSAWEFWQASREALAYRLPIIAALLTHAVFVLIRIPLSGSLSSPLGTDEIHVGWWTAVILEAVFFSYCGVYFLTGLARERAVLWYKRASLVDSLTGVGNRRSFLERGERLLARSLLARNQAVLMVLDIDRFKSINDAFGHQAGDQVLIRFCRVATAALRVGDLFGRIGGEEFAILLPDTSQDEGLRVAERIRANFEAESLTFGASTFSATVSIGLVSTHDQTQDLSTLIMAADNELYRAKRNGRNRIEFERRRSVDSLEPFSTAARRAAG